MSSCSYDVCPTYPSAKKRKTSLGNFEYSTWCYRIDAQMGGYAGDFYSKKKPWDGFPAQMPKTDSTPINFITNKFLLAQPLILASSILNRASHIASIYSHKDKTR